MTAVSLWMLCWEYLSVCNGKVWNKRTVSLVRSCFSMWLRWVWKLRIVRYNSLLPSVFALCGVLNFLLIISLVKQEHDCWWDLGNFFLLTCFAQRPEHSNLISKLPGTFADDDCCEYSKYAAPGPYWPSAWGAWKGLPWYCILCQLGFKECPVVSVLNFYM